MTLNFEDRAGQPRDDSELEEAIEAVQKALVVGFNAVPPYLLIQLTTIHSCLKELQQLRTLIAKARAQRQAESHRERGGDS